MSWRLFYGKFELAQLGVIFRKSCVHGKLRTTDLIVGLKKIYGIIFFALRKEVDTEWIFIDGSYVRVHQHGSGSRRREHRGIGRSHGGPTTKIQIKILICNFMETDMLLKIYLPN